MRRPSISSTCGSPISSAISTWRSRRAIYAHLQPGSITVAPGDNVITGHILGKIGNSGNSLAPHLHFGLLDWPQPETANILPFVLDRYTLTDTSTAAPTWPRSAEPVRCDCALTGAPHPHLARCHSTWQSPTSPEQRPCTVPKLDAKPTTCRFTLQQAR